jgi:Delta7-sterol 5-desaturase
MLEYVQTASLTTLALVVSAAFIGLTVVSSAMGYALEHLMRAKPIFAVPLDPGQTRFELIGNLKFLAVALPSFTFALHAKLIHFVEGSAFATWLSFVAVYLGFQASYYVLHRGMHTRSLVRFHRWHHLSRVTTPLSGQSMSVVEALGWMVCYLLVPAAMSYVMPLSFNGWLLYMAYNVFGNIYGHSNVEPVPVIPGLRYTSLINNVFTYHSLHHARWTGHYGFATTLFDRMFNSEWEDWQELHQRTATGNPLPSLKTRGRTGGPPCPPS